MSNSNHQQTFSLIAMGVIIVGLAVGILRPRGDAPRMERETFQGRVEAPDDITRESTQATPRFARATFSLSEFDIADRLQNPQLAGDAKGLLWLAWESQTADDQRSIFLTMSDDAGETFDKPRAVRTTSIYGWDSMMRGRPVKRFNRMWPSLAFVDGRLLLNWVESAEDDPSRQLLNVCDSSDLGKNFSTPRQLSGSAAVRPTFVGFDANDDGEIAAAWLDNRNDAQQPFAAVGGEVTTEHLVYSGPDNAGICPCCDLEALVTDQGQTIIAFRNSVNGFRDIWLSVLNSGQAGFSPPMPIVEPRWEYDGCPHDGPSMVVEGDQLHVVWMDAHSGTQQVYHAHALLGEWKFETRPVHPSAAMQGHPFLASTPLGLCIVWEETQSPVDAPNGHAHGAPAGSSANIVISWVDSRSGEYSEPEVVSHEDGEFQTRPVVFSSGDRLIFAWTSLSETGKKIVTVSRPLATPTAEMKVAIHE